MHRVGSVWGLRLRIDTSPFGPVFAAQAGRGKKVNAYIILYFEFVIIYSIYKAHYPQNIETRR